MERVHQIFNPARRKDCLRNDFTYREGAMRSPPKDSRLYFLIAVVLISACSGLPKSQRPEPSRVEPVAKTVAPPATAPTARTAEKTAAATSAGERLPARPSNKPRPGPTTVLLDHKYFQVYYDPKLRLPRAVVYTLTAEHLRAATTKRHDKFRADPLLVGRHQPYVDKKEYTRSGYDKGHMAPFKDFAWSQEGGEETFVMSNMVPQKPKLNQQAWEDLEEHVREWGCGEEKLTVVTGPLIEEGLSTLKSGLPIPRRFFKILIDETPPKKIIAFVYNQEDNHKGLTTERVTPVEAVTQESRLDFKAMIPSWDPQLFQKGDTLSSWKSTNCVGQSPLPRLGEE